ncbi:hypothetical protein K501DRAFT_285613 [Backusella circina FSU 941]|nr:hypothetical protein K501DRAFT_285613 [Backusella circina FSU 941]
MVELARLRQEQLEREEDERRQQRQREEEARERVEEERRFVLFLRRRLLDLVRPVMAAGEQRSRRHGHAGTRPRNNL